VTAARAPSLDTEGTAAPPRRNGELVFQEPWEGRAFGLAVTLCDQGLFAWDGFRRRLIEAIAEADSRRADENRPGYYASWLAALERLLVAEGVVTSDEIDARAQEFASGQRDIVDPGAQPG
jgi:nitrile hydratase accessory protein